MKRYILIVAGLVGSTMLILFILSSTIVQPNKQKNGFERIFIKDVLVKTGEIRFTDDIKDVCGSYGDTIFFSHRRPEVISYANASFDKFNTIHLNLPIVQRLAPVFYTAVQYPMVYILGGNSKIIIKGNMINNTYDKIPTQTASFSNAIVVNEHSFIVRMTDTPSLNALFTKIIAGKSVEVQTETHLSERLNDAGFTRDGMLSFDPVTNRLVYVCFYSNQVTCFDTSLNLIRRLKTLDSFNTPGMKVIHRVTSITNAEPPFMVNKGSCAYDGKIYVRSNLKADNEQGGLFTQNVIVDKYDLQTGKYIGSFYIPVNQDTKFKRFKMIDNNRLIAVYNDRVIQYKLN